MKLFRNLLPWAVLLILLQFYPSSILLAQRIKSEVILHTKALPLNEQNYLEGLAMDLTRAIDEFKWTDSKYNYELPIHIEIFFESYSLYGTYHKYKAGIMVAMRNGIQMRDSRWDFRLDRNVRFYISDTYDTFMSMLEYQIWLCLGFETDRLKLLGGSPYFEKAHLIAEKARFESQYYNGWDLRRELVEDLVVKKSYKNIRSASFYVNAGFYYFEKEEVEKAHDYFEKGIELAVRGNPKMLVLHRDDSIFRFIDVERLAPALHEIEAFKLLNTLMEWDPNRIEIYERK